MKQISVGRIVRMLASIVTAVALFYAVENFRGARAWQAERRRLEGKGEDLNWAKHIAATRARTFMASEPDPSLIEWRSPDFLVIPGFRRDFTGPPSGPGGAIEIQKWRMLLSHPESERVSETPCQAGQAFLKAAEVLEAPIRRMVEAARSGPVARWSIDPSLPPASLRLPPLLAIRQLTSRLRVRIAAHFACGHSLQAVDEMRLMARLGESLRGLPFLITYLIELSIEDSLLDCVHDGLARGHLGARDRGEVESLLTVDWLEGARSGLRSARNYLIFYAESPSDFAGPSASERLGLQLMPHGWLLRQAIDSAQFTEGAISLLSDPSRVDPRAIDNLAGGIDVGRTTPYNFIARIGRPSLVNIARSSIALQTRVNLTRIAFALLDYRDLHGSFPIDLAQVPPLPASVPRIDIVTGGALHYRKRATGFTLYSVGWNLTDDAAGFDSRVPFSRRPDWALALEGEE